MSEMSALSGALPLTCGALACGISRTPGRPAEPAARLRPAGTPGAGPELPPARLETRGPRRPLIPFAAHRPVVTERATVPERAVVPDRAILGPAVAELTVPAEGAVLTGSAVPAGGSAVAVAVAPVPLTVIRVTAAPVVARCPVAAIGPSARAG
jgi:hypothetical protein